MLRAATYRRHIENRIRPGNGERPWLAGMSRPAPAPRGPLTLVVGVVLLGAALAGVVLLDSADSLPPALSPMPATGGGGGDDGAGGEPIRERAAPGRVSDGVTVFDDTAAIANLDPALRTALRAAATDAASDGVELQVNSGWRSPGYQARLLEKAIDEHGSREEAARWVATPKTSPHVSGDAVDLGPAEATDWLAAHGASYGLCQIYDNEPWHYELRPDAPEQGCPPRYPDPTHDPRTQR